MPKRKFNRKLFNRVRRIANSLGISISMRCLPDEADHRIYGYSSRNKIFINNSSKLSWSVKLHVLLHEMGHYLYDKELTPEQIQKVNSAYLVLANSIARAGEMRTVLKTEANAWDLARDLASNLGIPTSKRMFHKLEQEGVDYYESLKKDSQNTD